MKRPAALALLVLVLLGAFLSLAATQPPSGPGPAGAQPLVGFSAPDFTLPMLNGKTLTLSTLRGTPVLVNFWASWCPPCRQEMPEIEKFHRLEGNGVAIVGVDFQEPAPIVQDFIGKHGFTWTFVLDGDGQVTSAYRVHNFPTSFFLDANGIVRVAYTGPMHLGQMESFLRQTESGR